MSKRFTSFKSLISEYEKVKMSVTSLPSIIPNKNDLRERNPGKSNQSNRENKLAFIADIEMFVRYFNKDSFRPIPEHYLLKIFWFAFCPVLIGKCDTYGKLLRYFTIQHNKYGDVPKRILNRGNLCAIVKSMKEKVYEYYSSKGLLYDDDTV